MNSPTPSPTPVAPATAPVVRPAFWGLAERVRQAGQRPRLRWRWGRLTLLAVGLVALGYLGMVTFFFVRFRVLEGYEQATFTRMLTYPFSRAEFNRERGDRDIAEAVAHVQRGELQRAYPKVQRGVGRSPKNTDGLMLLARIFLLPGMNRVDDAVGTLKAGFPEGLLKRDYLQGYLRLLLLYQRDDDVIAFAAEHLPTLEAKSSPDEATRVAIMLLHLAAAEAHYARGQFEQAEDHLRTPLLTTEVTALVLQARIDWDRGRRPEAIRLLEVLATQFPQNDEVASFLSRFYRENGELGRALRAAILRSTANLAATQPRVEIIQTYRLMGREADAQAEIERMARDLASNEEGMRALGNFATENGDTRLSFQLYENALRRGQNQAIFALLYIESLVVARDFAQALSTADALAEENPAWLRDLEDRFSSLRAVAHYGAGDATQGALFLERFQGAAFLRAETLLAVARRLLALGALEPARALVARAAQRDPYNQAALIGLLTVDLERGSATEVPTHVQKLLAMRRPPPELLQRVRRFLLSDRFLFDRDATTLQAIDDYLGRSSSGPRLASRG